MEYLLKMAGRRWVAVLSLIICQLSCSFAQQRISVTVTEKRTHEPIIMGRVVLQPIGLNTVTDAKGQATLRGMPNGQYTLQVSYVGFQTRHIQLRMEGKDLQMRVELEEASLSLKEVSVTARQNVSGSSTSSIIGRQAIDHLQATSLADIMQLVPGQLMGNHDLTQSSNLQLRQLVNNNTSAFGSSIVVDGVPMSNNGAVSQGTFSSTAFTGTDLRQIAADDIDEVEVVRGIPSAEYGDLTSGLVVVHSKVGVTPWQVKGKVNPGLMNYSLGKGENLGKAGIVNGSLDYAQAWGDPRMKTRSFHRYRATLGWSFDPTHRWHTTTKLRYMQAKDWTGNDPDAEADGTKSENKSQSFSLTHNGHIQTDKFFARTLSYTIGVSMTLNDAETSSFASVSSGLLPILTAQETGYYVVPFETRSYLATGITKSRPGNIYAKVGDQFFIRTDKTRQTFKLGADYHYDWNNGRGYYNADERYPLRPNSDGRPRAFSDIPSLHQIAAYAEDKFTWDLNKVNRLRATAGLRFTALQPFGDVATTALSPRINMSFSFTRWLDLRAGFGMNSKTPGLNYLYPDKKYADRVAANYMPQDDKAAQLLAYHTQVYEVKYSKDMKNATTTKVEVGIDIKLPAGRKLSLLAYRDKTPDGFGPVTNYFTYTSNFYSPTQGLIITPGQPTQIDYQSPARTDILSMTTGEIGNTNTTVNRGVEADMDFGSVKLLRTSFYLSGAWQETKTWSTDLNSMSPKAALLPTAYSSIGVIPFKVVYPSGLDYTKYRRFVTTLRTVTHIPELRMVASLTAQAIWHNWNNSHTADKDPIGWIDNDLVRHEITPAMLNGYLGMDACYYATKPDNQSSVSIQDLLIRVSDNNPSESPVTWNLQARLTKEFGSMGGLSFYVNNALYYEPYLKGNNTSTLTQRNQGFSFGAELYLNL